MQITQGCSIVLVLQVREAYSRSFEADTEHTDTDMTIDLSKEARALAVSSIERYFHENMEEPIGNVAAGGLLGFFLEEIGPSIYNKAVLDVQERLQARLSELDLEVHEEEFQYWRKYERPARGKK
jgi:uncharacterized protein (DUF2164 family)